MLSLQPENFRARLVVDLVSALAIPSTLLYASLRYSGIRLGFWSVLVYPLFILCWATTKGAYSSYKQRQLADQLGARTVPCVVGKWPGNVDVLLKMMCAFKTSYVLDVYLQLFEEYQCTTLNLRILWADNIISMDQEHIKFVLSTGFKNFWRGRAQKERMETLLGEGIFNRDDDIWKMHRNTARPFFARDRLADFEIFETYTSKTLSHLSQCSSKPTPEPCEAQDLFSRFALDAASEFLFGQNLDTLAASLPQPHNTRMGAKGSATEDSWGAFATAFDEAQMNITKRARIGYLWPLLEGFRDRNRPHAQVIEEWLDPIVRRAVEEKRRLGTGESPLEDKTFLQHLADSTENPVLIRDQLLNMLLASRDTTACVLTYITYFMSIHPEIAQKMRAEVLQHCGPHAMPTFAQIHELRYIRAVINESLRLFPPVPLNVRESRPDSDAGPCLLPPADRSYPCSQKQTQARTQPLYVPSKTVVTYFPLLTQRNPALWGADADEFRPERWLDAELQTRVNANPGMYMPFSCGPRVCIGKNYAYNEMTYFLVRLLQQFDRFELALECQPEGSLPPQEWKEEGRRGRQRDEKIWPAAALTLFIKGGLWVKFHKATSA
ncbi:cytochrome P450 monooxygenase CYP63 [Macrolepiota fuliginosa MF-IS2]|uniref:Cytochrome P450 monooxygenase CYP63 n=1 Tax=Macrolepiota fuliginosa MF-IS2 TaxID=1400762 RepID=A0A9P5X6T2_9AGAR|nr:cytochrome P450 monooxygenase CYP63 [Macrolepiota fuliginosa MF-IS2]